MKFDVLKKDGNVRRSASRVDDPIRRANTMLPVAARLIATLVFLAFGSNVFAQSMYKYQDEDGTWIYTDRQPADQQRAEVLDLPVGEKDASVAVTTSLVGREVRFRAVNDFDAPVELIIALDGLHNVELPMPDQAMRWVLAPHSSRILLELSAIEDNIAPQVDYRYIWLPGDPDSQHAPSQPYRAPFAVAGDYPITQAFPVNTTHDTVDSRYAVDFAMPVGTDIHAARAGIVFEVAGSNYRGGIDPEQDAQFANIIRILHDDGTHALYAHLNWNGIRVRPGDRVERGEYIAESGNTGFSSGPHLHFAVMQNLGMRLESLPIEFEAANGSAVTPTSGELLIAY